MNILKRLFCKHKVRVLLRFAGKDEDLPKRNILFPAIVCVDCQKLFWATLYNKKYTFLKPYPDKNLILTPPQNVDVRVITSGIAIKGED